MTKNELSDLETLIEQHGLPQVLGAIADACRTKSEHCACDCRGNTLARVWDERADVVSNAVFLISK